MTRFTAPRPKAFAKAVLAGTVLLVAPGSAAADYIIDTFDDPTDGQVVLDSTADGTPAVSVLTGQSVPRGSRELFANKAAPAVGTAAVEASSNDFDTGVFNFNQPSATVQGSARLIYDGGADGLLNATGLFDGVAGIDLTQGGVNTGFIFSGLQVLGSGLTLTANFYNALTGAVFSSGVVALPSGYSGDLFLPYSSFTGAGGSATPGNVGAIEIVVNATLPGSDLEFELVSSGPTPAAVPEPSSMLLLSLCGAAGGFAAWRRQKASAA